MGSISQNGLNVHGPLDGERVHAGEFLRLLHELAPDEEKFYAEGAREVEEEIAKQE